ncbi:NucA/NucB deoxyribonuclease domain-containing protein [Kribbella koreensis]
MAGATVTQHVTCQDTCAFPIATAPLTKLVTPSTILEAEASYKTTLTAGGTRGTTFTTTKWGIEFGGPNPSAINWDDVYNMFSPWARCDNMTPGITSVGCVVWASVPTIGYALSGPYPELASHIQRAQQSGLPGAPGGTPLTRIFTGDDSQDNRTAACPGSFTRPSGKSCDEYPFASSDEGARNSSNGRTFADCSIPQLPIGITGPGFSACMINAQQNSGGGSVLGGFYRTNRLLQGDKFNVSITA